MPACRRSKSARRRRPTGFSGWMPGAEQRLVRVDVPDARDAALVEQERLHGRGAAARRLPQHVGRERRVERLRAEPRVEVARRAASSPSITSPVPKRRWSVNSRRLPSSSTSRTRRCGRPGASSCRRDPQQVAGHAQVHDQVAILVEVGDQVLAAPAQPRRCCGRAGRPRRRAGRPARVHSGSRTCASHDRAPGHAVGELAADGLDLG